jgi:hypothetical protein
MPRIRTLSYGGLVDPRQCAQRVPARKPRAPRRREALADASPERSIALGALPIDQIAKMSTNCGVVARDSLSRLLRLRKRPRAAQGFRPRAIEAHQVIPSWRSGKAIGDRRTGLRTPCPGSRARVRQTGRVWGEVTTSLGVAHAGSNRPRLLVRSAVTSGIRPFRGTALVRRAPIQARSTKGQSSPVDVASSRKAPAPTCS